MLSSPLHIGVAIASGLCCITEPHIVPVQKIFGTAQLNQMGAFRILCRLTYKMEQIVLRRRNTAYPVENIRFLRQYIGKQFSFSGAFYPGRVVHHAG